jgi:SAM-dependent methyltransferase
MPAKPDIWQSWTWVPCTVPDSCDWDERYRRGEHPGPEPDPFLVQVTPLIRERLPQSGRALDLAGGAGRNAAYAAGLGFTVTMVDASAAALDKARARGVPLTLVQADLERGEYSPPPASFDLVMVFFYLYRPLFPALQAALKPGGLLVYRTYTVDRLRTHPDANPSFLLQPGELRNAFGDLQVLKYEEAPEKPVAALLAQRL